MQTRGVVSFSPSFGSYSNGTPTEVGARVVEELREEEEENSEDFYGGECFSPQNRETEDNSDSEDENEDFEFAFVTRESQISSPISADEIFCNGQIRPVFPILNKDLLLGNMNLERQNFSIENSGSLKGPGGKIRIPLRKLFIEERETASSGSSSEADELDGVPPETYCVWRQKAPAEQCNKSNSTGSSKRWRFRNLLHRSQSEGGKDTFVLFTPGKQKENVKIKKTEIPADGGKVKSTAAAQYSKKGEDRRKSYLPYRRDLVGLFSNVNGVSRNLQPF
ncbi:unnamed protein product [Fraxinus pennsylvanica]|uniref:Uncharacterized protein n=1 Tax=Fraxinus pennsylvanica TaxID=56036 RepID=A0AAD1YRK8_9LAMI|nr:unnamed protein product [Fraxinus pennsylvanica]